MRYEVDNVTTKNHQKIINAEKENLRKTIMNIQKFIFETNKLLFLFSSILIFIQTSIPSYNINNIKLMIVTMLMLIPPIITITRLTSVYIYICVYIYIDR